MGDQDSKTETSRRSFLDVAIVGGSAAVGLASVYPAVRFLQPVGGGVAGSVTAGKVSEFSPNSSKSVRLGETPVLVVRDAEGTFHAYVAICPHLQCVVRFAPKQRDIECACHGGRFALSGGAVAGPPKKPLEVLQVNVIGEDVVVSRA